MVTSSLPAAGALDPFFRDLVYRLATGPPRGIFGALGWHIGDEHDQQCSAALLISSLLAALAVAIYAGSAHCCCSARMRRRYAAQRRAELHPQDGAVSARGGQPLEVLWTVHNKRYDLRPFVAAHPGGAGAILLGQGRNCTELFESYHSLAREQLVRAKLRPYFVEDAAPGAADFETEFEWQVTPFYDELKRRVREHFETTRGSARAHFADARQWLQLIFFVCASGVVLRGFMQGSLCAALLLPFCYWWGPSSCMHDGGHFSLSRFPWLNDLLSHIGGAHMSHISWQHQHTIGHHVHTNVAGADPDLYHFGAGADMGLPGFRTSLEMRTLPEKTFGGEKRSRWWRRGLLVRVPLTTFGPSVIWDLQSWGVPDFGNAFLGLVPFRQVSMSRLYVHSAGRAIVIWLAIIHPITVSLVTSNYWAFGFAKAAVMVIVPFALHGCLFYAFSQVSHVQSQCLAVPETATPHAHPHDKLAIIQMIRSGDMQLGIHDPGALAAQPQAKEAKEWAVHQVEHALDYATGSRFWLHASVGLNLQVVHHLFPQVAWGHYKDLSPIVEDVCRQFGVRYASEPSFWAALRSHYDHLVAVNGEPNASLWLRPPQRRGTTRTLNALDQVDPVFVRCIRHQESDGAVLKSD